MIGLMRLIPLIMFGFYVEAAICADWNYNRPSYDPSGAAQLNVLNGAVKVVSNTGQNGVQSSASPTVLSVSVGGDVSKELYNISVTPPVGRYRAVLSVPMVVGEFYEITTFYHRTGGSGVNQAYYHCVPVRYGVRIIQYAGPGQVFTAQSACSTNSSGLTMVQSTFTIVDSKTIDGLTSYDFNEYYGYDNHNVASVKASAVGKKEIYSLAQTPAQDRYRANLYEPLVVGNRYEITGYWHRTGGMSTHNAYYKCIPVVLGERVIEYAGPGQSFTLQSTCMSGSSGHRVMTTTFVIRDSRTIDGYTSSEFNEYYGYDNNNIFSVVALPPP